MDLARHHGRFVLSAKGLRRHTASLASVLQEVLAGARFDELERLRDLLAQTRADLEMGISDRGHQLAMYGAARGLSPGGWLADVWDGPCALQDIQRLDDAADSDPDSLRDLMTRFSALRDRLLGIPPQILLVGEDDSLALARAEIAKLPPASVGQAPEALVLPSISGGGGMAWLTNTEVNFCAKAYAAVPEGHPDAPALAVLARYLADGFLHPEIREKGGAYGGGASFDSDSGCFFFYSYRDPRLAGTLEDFDRALVWFKEQADPVRLEESVLGVIRSLDKPRSPAGAAIEAFHGAQQARTAEFKARYRAAALAITQADLARVAERYLVPGRGAIGVVTHRGEEATIAQLGLGTERL